MTKIIIGFVDTDPDTGEEYTFVRLCECDGEWAANWIVATLKRDLAEHSDEPNREIKIKYENT
ncbi:hypothetical protein UFOVP972_56 [uncultured Caudovirales phage]|jgi:hypothetical protein|uniref:Uncharacterized protein n=1 Tax=uncultured Caudovirales phage TaxID=2100421 RepID=A0A6J5PUQ0_9CAUD|nr:hypothetical protein UFOVP972_56 [uncultured Caudovirales phage]